MHYAEQCYQCLIAKQCYLRLIATSADDITLFDYAHYCSPLKPDVMYSKEQLLHFIFVFSGHMYGTAASYVVGVW